MSLFYVLCSGVLCVCSLSLFLCLELLLFLWVFDVCSLFLILLFLLSCWSLFWCSAISSYSFFAFIVPIPCVLFVFFVFLFLLNFVVVLGIDLCY